MSDGERDGELLPPRHLVLVHAPEHAFVPMTRTILSRLGYALLDPEVWRESSYWASREPALHVVDEPRLATICEDAPFGAPILLLSGRRGATPDDPRLLGAVHKPAGLHELYRLLQQALEETPRSAPRVDTGLPAQVTRKGCSFEGEVLSLSESGCLLRSTQPLPLGSAVELSIRLPGGECIDTRAVPTYQILPDTGLVFESTHPACRQAIARFVQQALIGV